jgi:hypothetical protein
MQLDLLLPREWQHPSKEFLKARYGRIGYRLVGTTTVDDRHRHLSPLLATPCDLALYEKTLKTHRNVVSSRPSRSFA